jgi:serine protease Do
MKNLFASVIFILLLTTVYSLTNAQSSTQKPFMGVTISDTIPSPIRKQYKLKDKEGVQVLAIIENSSAQGAGIQVNDVLVGVNDSTIRSTPQFIALVQSHKVGETIKLTLYREGKKKVQPVLLKPR